MANEHPVNGSLATIFPGPHPGGSKICDGACRWAQREFWAFSGEESRAPGENRTPLLMRCDKRASLPETLVAFSTPAAAARGPSGGESPGRGVGSGSLGDSDEHPGLTGTEPARPGRAAEPNTCGVLAPELQDLGQIS